MSNTVTTLSANCPRASQLYVRPQKSPDEGASYRGERIAILNGEFRKIYQDEKIYEIICRLDSETEDVLAEHISVTDGYDAGDLKRELEIYLRELDRERSIPANEYVEFSRILERSQTGWLNAKKEDDYRGYAPLLQEVIDGYKKITSLKNSDLSLYDRMLDDHQPGWNKTKYDFFFNDIKERLIPIVRNCADLQAETLFS